MAFNIGELVAYLRVDDSDYQRKTRNAQQVFTGLANSAQRVGQVIATSFTAGTVATTGLLTGLMKVGGGYNSMQQNSRAALKTILGSTEKVNEQMAKLDSLASKSPFSKAAFIEGQQQLLAFGYAAEEVIPTLDAVQNAVAATGGSSQQLSDLVFVMAQIRAAGKITGQDLIQFGQRGVNAAQLIGDAMGMTVAETKEAISKNQIDVNDALNAITTGMMKKFGGATDAIKQQWSGATDRIKAAWRDTGAVIAKPFIDPNGGGQAVVWANRVADLMRQVQKHVQTLMDALVKKNGKAFDLVTRGIERASAAVARFNVQGFIRQIEGLTKHKAAISGTMTALTLLGSRPLPFIGALGSGLIPVVAGIAAFVHQTGALDGVGTKLADIVRPALPFLKESAKTIADVAVKLVDILAPALIELGMKFAEFFTTLSPLAPVLTSVLNILPPVASAAASLVTAVAGLPAPLLAATAAMVAFHVAASAGKFAGIAKGITSVVDGMRLFGMYAKEVGVFSAAMMTGSSAVTAFGTAVKVALGPVGLVIAAIGVLTYAVTAWAQEQKESQERVDALTDSLDQQTGAITDNTRAIAYKQLQDNGAIEAAKSLGLSLKLVTDAALGDVEAQKKLSEETTRLNDMQREQYETAAKSGEYTGNLAERMNTTAKNVKTLSDGVGTLSTELTQAKSAQKDFIEVTGKTAESAENAADAQRRHAEALDAVNRAQREQAAAAGDLIAARYANMDATEKLSESMEKLGEIVYTNNGKIDTSSQKNQDFVLTVRDKIRAVDDELRAMQKNGSGQEELNNKREEYTNALIDQISALDGNREAAAALVEELGGIPETISTIVEFDGDKAPVLAEVSNVIEEVTKSHPVMTIYAKDDPAMATLLESLGAVDTGNGTFTINAKDDPAAAKLIAALGTVDKSTGTITIDGKNDKAKSRAVEAQNYIRGLTPKLSIGGQNWEALESAEEARRRINGMVATLQIRGAYEQSNIGGLPMARGGVVEYYARGGLRENHVAQIAPAGSMRVWAEPETGGEGYIPLAPHKRARSRQIMAEIAARFGDVYIPRGQGTQFNAGGVNSPSAAPTATAQTVVNINGVTIDAHTLDAVHTVQEFIQALGYSQLMEGARYA